MSIEQIREFALSLPGATEDIKWGDHLCFNVAEKMFMVTTPDQVPVTASFKVGEVEFTEIIQREGFYPQPYMARHHWVGTENINRMNQKEWEHYIKQSYSLVTAKLSSKIKKSLGLI